MATPRKRRTTSEVIAAIIEKRVRGEGITTIAQMLSIDIAALKRLCKTHEFTKLWRDCLIDKTEQIDLVALGLRSTALRVLADLAIDPATPAGVRRAAAKDLIDASDVAIGRLLPRQSDGAMIDALTILVANGLLPEAMVGALQSGLTETVRAARAAGVAGHTEGLNVEDLEQFELDLDTE